MLFFLDEKIAGLRPLTNGMLLQRPMHYRKKPPNLEKSALADIA